MDIQLGNLNPAICGSLKGSGEDQSITIPLNVEFTLGRDDTCQFQFFESLTYISSRHCRICGSMPSPSSPDVQLTFSVFLLNLSESSETWVNDRKLAFSETCQLHDRDNVTLGFKQTERQLVLTFRLYNPLSIQALIEFGPLLGKGSFGEVVAVRGYRTGQLYAMKIVRDNEYKSWNAPNHVVRREVEAMKRIDHPHIVYMFAYFREDQFVFILTELCLCTVEDLVAGGRSQGQSELRALEQDPARVITYQTCLGLRYLHSINIVHRDVKPSNVMVSCLAPLTVKLGDFGTAKQTENAGAQTCVGSPAYIAPEVAKTRAFKGTYDYKADSWSIGVMIFFMLSAGYPFHSEALKIGKSDGRKEVLWERFPSATHFADARDIIGKLLQRKPTHRLSMSDTIAHAWLRRPS